jgi:hypothetical protein
MRRAEVRVCPEGGVAAAASRVRAHSPHQGGGGAAARSLAPPPPLAASHPPSRKRTKVS